MKMHGATHQRKISLSRGAASWLGLTDPNNFFFLISKISLHLTIEPGSSILHICLFHFDVACFALCDHHQDKSNLFVTERVWGQFSATMLYYHIVQGSHHSSLSVESNFMGNAFKIKLVKCDHMYGYFGLYSI